MSATSPLELMFGNLPQQGPGSDAETLGMLAKLPVLTNPVVVDAGCGTGRQTLALAGKLRSPVQAVDTFASSLDFLNARAQRAGLADLITTHRMSMAEIHKLGPIDLIWSEGAAYSIGFPNALRCWFPALKPQGWVVVSELAWLTETPPQEAADFFSVEYPDMCTLAQNQATAEGIGYQVQYTHVLPGHCWTEGYYSLLKPRAQTLREHEMAEVRALAEGMLEEIRIFERHGDSYGYVFYLLQKP